MMSARRPREAGSYGAGWSSQPRIPSSGEAAVVVDEAAEHWLGNDLTLAWVRVGGLRRQMLQGLVRPALVVVPDEAVTFP